MIIVPECGFYNEEINDPDSPYPGECEDCYRYEICLKASKEMENQKNNIIYGVFGGCYSDWYIVGYFNDRELAEKYCCAFGDGDYYVQPIKDLTNKAELSTISIGYRHRVLFDIDEYKRWIIRHDPDNYTCYLSNKKQPNCIELGNRWIRFNINIDKNNRKKAEKIAQDYLYELLSYGDGIVTRENIGMMNDRFAEPFRIAEEQRKQKELKQKELAELKRLKEKYES